MADGRNLFRSYFLHTIILTIVFCHEVHPSAENRMGINYSNGSLRVVPRNLAAETTVLDLSHNHISKIQMSDLSYLSRLQVLILSHNSIKELDLSTFQYNEDLEYLDVSHNKLQIISCYPLRHLRHLNIIYNSHADLPVCLKSGKVLKLEYLGLSARSLQESGLGDLAHLQLSTLVLSLEDLSGYRPDNFTVFGAKHLHLIFPPKSDFRVLRNLESGEVRRLELSNIEGKQLDDLRTFLVKLNKNSTLQNLMLNNIKWHWGDFIDLLQTVWYSIIEYFNISNTTQLEVPNKINFHYNQTSLRSLTITHTTFTSVYSTPVAMYNLFLDMNITALTISDAGLIHMLCPSKISHYTYLNFSNNSLTDAVFKHCTNLSLLEKLVLKSNLLKNLTNLSLMTKCMKSLKYLDTSRNFLQYEDHGNKCGWSQSLVEVDFSFNILSKSVFSCLPVGIQRLHLQNNKILAIPKESLQLTALEEINLASNKLADLPGCGQFRSLRFLDIEKNLIFSPSSDFYQTCQGIMKVKAGHNPFLCKCELRSFINLGRQGYVKMADWPDSYTCRYPADLRGTHLKDFHISELACNVALLITVVLVVTVVLVAAVSFLCIRFDIPWYLKMMWHWTRAKHRIWKKKPQDLLDNICFHAFVSYSEHDSDWVKNVLIRNLEKEDGSIRICQHERNFIAGKSIVENIIDCVEKSYKSIFVLSPHFVQSEWCHYELYFAHHKLFSENADGLILVLLDSIPACTIPSRYHMLKSLMARRTYLEWPKEKGKQGLFWANLRAAIQIKLPNNKTVG